MITMAARKRKTASICPGMRSCAFGAGICWPNSGGGHAWARVRSFFFVIEKKIARMLAGG
jgi:hypothetical protein